MTTLADMTPEERAECVGMWCDYRDGNGTKTAIIIETWITIPEACMVYDIAHRENRQPLGSDVTPRYDLPRAWAPDGTPPEGAWEYDVLPKDDPANPAGKEAVDRRWTGEWEPVEEDA